MDRWPPLVICGLCMLAACRPPVDPRAAPVVPAQVRMAAAAGLVRAGCLDCLIQAYQTYKALVNDPARGDEAAAAAVRAAGLIAIRERELGIVESGTLVEARALAGSVPELSTSLAPLLEIIDTLGARGAAGNSPVTSDAQLAAVAKASRNRTAWKELLRADADANELAAYLSLAFSCNYDSPTNEEADALFDALPTWRDAPLLRYRLATCTAPRMPALQQLLADDPRFVEITHYMGIQAVMGGDLDEADAQFARAYAWRPRWPGLTNLRAGIFMTAEDFESAADFYGRTLALVADHPEALLGRIRALTYGGRYADALIAVDALLALERWYVGDAYYWRAMNLEQLARHDEAWDDIERAAALITNADVPKLAGIIAVQRQQMEVARAKFEEAHGRNASDCETSFYLGVVLSELREWSRSVDVLDTAAACLDRSLRDLEAQIVRIRESQMPPERQGRQIARREREIAAEARMRATAWFNTAVASFNLSRYADARRYAEQVIDDSQFGERARALISQVPAILR